MKRFWDKVHKGHGCWEWQASTSRGYGQFWLTGRQLKAHRVAWELINGPIPDGLHVCHTCDNRLCCNVDHMFLGTAAENNLDKAIKNRASRQLGEAHPGSKLTDEHVHMIRALYARGWTQQRLANTFRCARSHVQKIVTHQTRIEG